jgi:hypothetical protein
MSSERRAPPPVFLDADVLAAPVSRPLLLIGARSGGGALFAPVWSEQVEAEADRPARTGQVAVSVLRASKRFWP